MTQQTETPIETLERAAKCKCPTCDNVRAVSNQGNVINRTTILEGPPSACPDCQGTGRKYPSLGRECPGDAWSDEIDDWEVEAGDYYLPTGMAATHYENIGTVTLYKDIPCLGEECRQCGGTGVVPVLDREACDAAAERLGYGISLSYPSKHPSEEGFYYHVYSLDVERGIREISASFLTRLESAQDALAKILAIPHSAKNGEK